MIRHARNSLNQWYPAVVLILFLCIFNWSNAADDYWVGPMGRVHERFNGTKGTFAHFGDSITVTLAFWTPLLYEVKNPSPQMEKAHGLVKDYMHKDCWRNWKGPRFGNSSGQTIRWAHKYIDKWLEQLNPEVVLMMFGTNDLNSVGLEEFSDKTRQVTGKCLENGTVVILSTIPPRHGFTEKVSQYNKVIKKTAERLKVPLIDYHGEIIKRRPYDWDGANESFSGYSGYDVPTLIARDGVHPSNPRAFVGDYSPRALDSSGYSLRNYLVLMKYSEVIRALGLSDKTEKALSVRSRAIIDPPVQGWFAKAPPLEMPTDNIVHVSDTAGLIKALKNTRDGTAILLADGHYMMPHYVEIASDNVSLRSASGDRRRVVIDGAKSRDGELIGFRTCTGVTVADLTIQNIKWNGFKINSETNVQDLTIYNCIIHNIWQRGVKGVKVPAENRELIRPKGCRISHCLFYNDRAKRYSDDPADTEDNFRGNYIGGIDVMFAQGWTISDNVFIGLKGRTNAGRGAVFLWHDTRDCIVERNVIIDCDAGICLGNAHRPEDIRIHSTNCIARNNFITSAPQGGIVTVYTDGCKLLNNTLYDPQNKLNRSIRVVFDNENLKIHNNLICGPDIRYENTANIEVSHNLITKDTELFVDPENGNLHLVRIFEGINNRALPSKSIRFDINRNIRKEIYDIGAHELE